VIPAQLLVNLPGRLAVQEFAQVLLAGGCVLLILVLRGLGEGHHGARFHVTFLVLLTSDNVFLVSDKVDLAVLRVNHFFRGNDGDRDADVHVSEVFTDKLVQGISVHELVGYGTHAGSDGVE